MKLATAAILSVFLFSPALKASEITETLTLNLALTERTQSDWEYFSFKPPQKVKLNCYAIEPAQCKYYQAFINQTIVNEPSFPQITWKYQIELLHWTSNSLLSVSVTIFNDKDVPLAFGRFRIADQPYNSPIKVPFKWLDAVRVEGPVIDPVSRQGQFVGIALHDDEKAPNGSRWIGPPVLHP